MEQILQSYYGWRFAAYLGGIFTASAVGAGIIMHALFRALNRQVDAKLSYQVPR